MCSFLAKALSFLNAQTTPVNGLAPCKCIAVVFATAIFAIADKSELNCMCLRPLAIGIGIPYSHEKEKVQDRARSQEL